MQLKNSLFILLLPLFLLAQQPKENDVTQMQEALQQFMLFMQKATESLKDLSTTKQKAVPEDEHSWMLYYKKLKNAHIPQKRNDLLIKTQLEYNFLTDKSIPSSTILVTVHNGRVELYGKVNSKETADKALDIALHTRGVKEVVSYLIIKFPAKSLI
ncbi:BON domain-containing protein [Nitratiruptor sp. YY09-18]|uniref:BON domain-containing protein n=1 Tax=Nitratiruptor sp. YY09-18 TaxID=2724901 RepID=UPI001915DCFA|nr:BON domain-containing protein [Nitratiruptor sp. YY09-18]BCD68819.1 hypothetical protein NitYY0918_C1738 [Nitratiruptor sp. YY09-18]